MADTGGVSAGDVGFWGGIAVMAGTAIKWLWGARREARGEYHAKLKAWEEDINRRREQMDRERDQRLDRLEEAERAREGEHKICLDRVDKLLFFCTLLVDEMEAAGTASPVIARARAYLRREFPEAFGPQPPVPADMAQQLRRIDAADG